VFSWLLIKRKVGGYFFSRPLLRGINKIHKHKKSIREMEKKERVFRIDLKGLPEGQDNE